MIPSALTLALTLALAAQPDARVLSYDHGPAPGR
jgi:hypothetical protein